MTTKDVSLSVSHTHTHTHVQYESPAAHMYRMWSEITVFKDSSVTAFTNGQMYSLHMLVCCV